MKLKLLFIFGIPLTFVAVIVVLQFFPEYWWVLIAIPLALIRYLARRTLTEKPMFRESPIGRPDITDENNRSDSGRRS